MLDQAFPLSQALSPFSYYLLQYNYSCAMSSAALCSLPSLLKKIPTSYFIIFSYFPFSTLTCIQSYTPALCFSEPDRCVVQKTLNTSYYLTSVYVLDVIEDVAVFLGSRRVPCAACPCLFNLNIPGQALLTGAI